MRSNGNGECVSQLVEVVYNENQTYKRNHFTKCNVCNKFFQSALLLSIHKEIVHNRSIKQEELIASGNYGPKQQYNHLKERFESTLETFYTNRRLNNYTDRKYKCEFCKKAFTQNNALKEHRRIHTHEKPFKCDLCDRAFTQSHALKEHRRIHTGEKPYECFMCKMTFRVRPQLMSHKCLVV